YFYNITSTIAIYTLSLHDALPICSHSLGNFITPGRWGGVATKRHKKAQKIQRNSCDVFCFFVATSFPPFPHFQYPRGAATSYRLRRREDAPDRYARVQTPRA